MVVVGRQQRRREPGAEVGEGEHGERGAAEGSRTLAADARTSIWEAMGAAGSAQVRVAPVGEAFRHVRSAPRGHGKQQQAGGASTLFHRLYEQDGVHLSDAGLRLAALVLAHTIHGVRPSSSAVLASVGVGEDVLGAREVHKNAANSNFTDETLYPN